MKTTFVWPYYAGNAHYDELRWSIRSVEKYCKDDHEVLVVGDKPDWYAGPVVERARAGKGRAFATGLNDALGKWLHALQISTNDRLVWMMDDCFFTKPFHVSYLEIPRASSQIGKVGGSGFRNAKMRSKNVLAEAGLPCWDFATHLPHAVDRQKAIEVFDRFEIRQKKLLWEVIYRNATLTGDPAPVTPFFQYLVKPKSDAAIKKIAAKVTCFNTSRKAWNEPVRRHLFADLEQQGRFESAGPKPPIPLATRKGFDESKWTPHGRGWTAPNGKSPEYEYVDFLVSLIKLNKPKRIIETGMGSGFVTKHIDAAKPVGATFTTYESDAKFRDKSPVCKCIVSSKETPAVGDIKEADLVILDSETPVRMREIELWHKYGKAGSTMIVHDVSDRHGPEKIHTQLLNHVRGLGIEGSLLRNPRGGFLATKAM